MQYIINEDGTGGSLMGDLNSCISCCRVHCEAANRSPLKSFKHQRAKPATGEKNTFAAALASQL